MAKVELYGADYCPFCRRAQALLEQKGVPFQKYDVAADPGLRQAMAQRGALATTIPQIFIDDKPIGGCDDLHALEANGELDKLLATH